MCFFAWSMLGPLGPTLQKQLDSSEFQLAVAVAIPVVLGSLMRIPIGILTERYGGRRVFTALMAYSVVPLVLLALFHDSFASVVSSDSCSASPARRSRSASRSSTAGMRRSARASRSASTAWAWAGRCSRR